MKKTVKLTALLIAALTLLALLCACAVKADPNPVIMTVDDLDITKFDFNMVYANNEDYYYYMYGLIDQEEYFNRVMSDLTKYAVAVARAMKDGITLDESDEAEIAEQLEEQCEYVFDQYRDKVVSTVTDEKERDAEAERLYELDMGYSFDEGRRLLEESLRRSRIARKLYDQVTVDVTPDERQIHEYMQNQVIKQSRVTFSEFKDNYNSFIRGEGDAPFFVPDECFTVNNLFLAYTNNGTEDEPVYDTAMADLKAENIDSLLSLGVSAEEFGKLVRSMGEDELMKQDTCFDWGYLIHSSLEDSYEKGFVYAAMQLADVRFKPSDDENKPEKIDYFTTTDNRQIAKFSTEKGINYLIVNRRFIKGDIPYENGDEVWNLAYEGAYKKACDKVYDEAYETWFGEAKITYYYDRFKSEYVTENTQRPN